MRKVLILLSITTLLTAGYGLIIKGINKENYDFTINDINNKTFVSIIDFYYEFYNEIEVYENYIEYTENFVEARMLEKVMFGNNILARVEIINSNASNLFSDGDIIEITELYKYDQGYEYSDTVYIPMQIGESYYINIIESDIYPNRYEFLTDMYSCILVDREYNLVNLNGIVELNIDQKIDNVEYYIDINSETPEVVDAIIGENIIDFTNKFNELSNEIINDINILIKEMEN